MSTITKEWNEEKIRWIIANLDKKTGLHGAEIPIVIANHAGALGCYQYRGEEKFWFKPAFINDDNTPESAVIDLIRHEYGHYYVHAARLERFVGHSKRETSHGKDWKWACKMIGAIPERCYDPASFKGRNWSVEEADAAYKADDVVEFDILSFVNKWNQVPILDEEFATKMLAQLKERHPNAYYEVGDEVYHPQRGYGIVKETIPCNYWTQKMHVQFEDRTDGVFTARMICKIVDGVAVPFGNDANKNTISNEKKHVQLSIEDLFPSVM